MYDPAFKQDFLNAPDGRAWELRDVITYVPNLPRKGGLAIEPAEIQYDKGYCGAFGPCVAMHPIFGYKLSPLFHIANCYLRDGLEHPKYEGTTAKGTLEVCRKDGFIPEEMLPYLQHKDTPVAQLPITPAMRELALKNRVGGYARCRTVEDVKQALYAGFPVIYAHLVSKELAYDVDGYVRSFFGSLVGGHISDILQWDDDMKMTFVDEYATHHKVGFLTGGQTWLDRNRPGANKLYGDDGLIHMSYDVMSEKTDLGMSFMDGVWALIPTAAQASTFVRRKKVVTFQIGNQYYTVNGVRQKIDLNSPLAPMLVNGRTLIPVRVAAEALGCKVEWDEAAQKVTFTDVDKDKVELVIGSNVLEVNDFVYDKKMDQAAIIISNRTFVPLRFLSEALSATVTWDAPTSTATVTKY